MPLELATPLLSHNVSRNREQLSCCPTM
jgi:hypothetical protein